MRRKILLTIIFKLFWDYLMFYQIFFSPQVKRCAIITYKHGIYELPHEFPNDLRLRMLVVDLSLDKVVNKLIILGVILAAFESGSKELC